MNSFVYTRVLFYVLLALLIVGIWIKPLQLDAQIAQHALRYEFEKAFEYKDPRSRAIDTVIANWDCFSKAPRVVIDLSSTLTTYGPNIVQLSGVQNPEGRVMEIMPNGRITELARFRIQKGATLAFIGRRDSNSTSP